MTHTHQSPAEIARALKADVELLCKIRARRDEIQHNNTTHSRWQEYHNLIDQDVDTCDVITQKLIKLHESGALAQMIEILSAQEAGRP